MLTISQQEDGYTPLHVACRHGHGGSVQYLMQLGCDIEARESNGRTALHLSALFGHALTCALGFPPRRIAHVSVCGLW